MRLRVGEIEMDSDAGVSFGRASHAVSQAPEAGARAPSLSRRLTEAPRWVWAAVAVASAGFVVVTVAVAIAASFWPLALPGLLFARLALYAGFLAGAPRGKGPAANVEDERLILRLVRDGGELTVEELIVRVGWEERRVVAALVALVERREVDEDLDVETGRWLYRPTTTFSGAEVRRTLSAHDRLRAIESEHTEEHHIEN